MARSPATRSWGEAMTEKELHQILAQLETCTRQALPALWERYGTGPRPLAPLVTRYLLAWNLQAAMYGGLSMQTKRRIAELQKAYAKDVHYRPPGVPIMKPGTEFLRYWKGQPHRVRVSAMGFDYQGQTYATLSEIARLITGTRWSGPKFFGLKGKAALT